MKELAKLFQRLGAEDALNLDGGGSSIMLARQLDGSLAVLNSPSDGHPRPVANGLEVTYDAVLPRADAAGRDQHQRHGRHRREALRSAATAPSPPVITSPDSPATTWTSVGDRTRSRPRRRRAACPSGTSVLATALLHPRRQRVGLELRVELLYGGVVAQRYGDLGHRATRRGLGEHRTSSKSTSPSFGSTVGVAGLRRRRVLRRRAGRRRRRVVVGGRAGLLVPAAERAR